MVISVAEMQQDWGELTQTFLSPDLPAAWLLTVWVLVTPDELWGGGEWCGSHFADPVTSASLIKLVPYG